MVDMDADTFVAAFGGLGFPEDIAREMKQGIDAEMARCILALYRDAAQPAMRALGSRFIEQSPKRGLVIIAENDHYAGPHETHEEIATAVGAKVRHLEGCGHWWMLEKPEEAARMLAGHWIK
jgi:pimeloyl-ACP methyl ester carboxylesterase